MKRKKSFSSRLFAAVMALSLVALAGLFAFRFHASRLEILLSDINKGIERYTAEEVELRQVFSSLISPMKIYGYCKDALGMDKVKQVEAVRIEPREHVVLGSRSVPQKGWRSSVLSIFGFSMN